MKRIVVKFMVMAMLFSVASVSAKEVELGAVSPPLDWPRQAPTPALTSQITGGLPLGCNLDSPNRYFCFNEYYISSDNRSASSHVYLQVIDRDPSKYLNTYNHTAQLITKFETGEFDGNGAVVPGIVSGLIQSSGTLGTGVLSLEGWAAYGVKVEIYKSPTENIQNGYLIGGAVAVSEGCSGTVPSGLELFEPCRNVFSNDVPISIPVMLTENTNYFIVVTTSCDAQGVDVSCYGTEFIFDYDDKNSKGVRTVASNFVVSVGNIPADAPDAIGGASQESVDMLQDSVDNMQTDVGNIYAFSETNQLTNQASFNELLANVNALSTNVNMLLVNANNTQSTVNDLRATVNNMQTTIDALEANVSNLQATVNMTQVTGNETNVAVNNLNSTVNNLQININQLATSIDENKTLIEANQADNESKLDELIRLVKEPLGKRKKH